MSEKIGDVVLNLDYYSGSDLYSDGKIEDELLKFVKHNKRDMYDEFIQSQNSWAVLYHLSPIRQNIVSSFPISKEHSVLEIGAGCGAITGKLCEKAGSVTCIELSKKRSLINAYRNKEYSNLQINVGNFQDVEKNIDQQFDWITLIGVYEYAESYIDSNAPYHDFIRIVMKHLKKGGHLIVAIENRFGLKYFAGCKEDHVNMYFEGIEGYSNSSGVRTFTKEEIENNFAECGYTDLRFLYPYPDYKFPFAIYSDEYLPRKGDLNMNMINFDQNRQVLFDEAKVYDTMANTKLFPIFSNSYLIDVVK